MCELAFSELSGPLVVQGAGHFVQWERHEVLIGATSYYLPSRMSGRGRGERRGAVNASASA
jgi:hypothetical protein